MSERGDDLHMLVWLNQNKDLCKNNKTVIRYLKFYLPDVENLKLPELNADVALNVDQTVGGAAGSGVGPFEAE